MFQKLKSVQVSSILVSTLAVFAQVSAADCVPTMSEADARARMTREVSQLDETLSQRDEAAMNNYNVRVVEVAQSLQGRRAAAAQEYREVKAVIMSYLGSDWRQQLDRAAQRYNEQLAEADQTYTNEVAKALEVYNSAVTANRQAYTVAAQKIADDYNRATCAN